MELIRFSFTVVKFIMTCNVLSLDKVLGKRDRDHVVKTFYSWKSM